MLEISCQLQGRTVHIRLRYADVRHIDLGRQVYQLHLLNQSGQFDTFHNFLVSASLFCSAFFLIVTQRFYNVKYYFMTGVSSYALSFMPDFVSDFMSGFAPDFVPDFVPDFAPDGVTLSSFSNFFPPLPQKCPRPCTEESTEPKKARMSDKNSSEEAPAPAVPRILPVFR